MVNKQVFFECKIVRECNQCIVKCYFNFFYLPDCTVFCFCSLACTDVSLMHAQKSIAKLCRDVYTFVFYDTETLKTNIILNHLNSVLRLHVMYKLYLVIMYKNRAKLVLSVLFKGTTTTSV